MNSDDETQRGDPVFSNAPTGRVARAESEVGGYELGELLGRGGMGEVVAAHDHRIEREVALKRMRGGTPSAESVARFIREAKIQARLDHPAIVPVHDLGRDSDGLPYFTMKRLAGTTLAARLAARGPIQPLLRAFVDVCFAVELAHSRDVVHRDLKPSNIMLGDYGDVYVLDWGVARVIGAVPAPTTNLPLDASAPEGTATGSLLGTPGYMAPEQMRGDDVGAAADVYALGAILFEILAGESLHPSGGEAIASTLSGAVECSPAKRAPLRTVAPELDAACVAALAEDPTARPTARKLATRVQAYLDGDRDLDHRRALAAASLAEAHECEAAGDRVKALRAASRAVALDPELREAAELATALILTPPREIPAEALAELQRIELELDRSRGLRGARAYLFIWALIPMALFAHGVYWPQVVGLIAGGTAMSGVVRLHVDGRAPNWFLLLGNVAFGVLFARLGGPLLLTPLFACGIAMGVGTQARYGDRRRIALAMVVVIIAIPFGLELAGVLAQTSSMTPAGLLFRGSVFLGHELIDLVGMLLGTIGLGLVVVSYALAMNRSRRLAQRELAVQAWHLKQLLRR